MVLTLPTKPAQAILNRRHPLSQGLVHFWAMTEGAGLDIVDCVQGAVASASTQSWEDGILGHAASIADTDSRVFQYDIDSNHPLAGSRNWSLLLVSKSPLIDSNSGGWSYGRTSSATLHLLYPRDTLGSRLFVPGGTLFQIFDDTAPDEEYRVYVLSSSTEGATSRYNLYIDGVLEATGTRDSTLDSSPTGIWIGGWNSGQPLHGEVLACALYDCPLSHAEAGALTLDPFAPVRPEVQDGSREFFFSPPVVSSFTATGLGAVPGFAATGVGEQILTATGTASVAGFSAVGVGEQIHTATATGAVPSFAATGVGVFGFDAVAAGAVPAFSAVGVGEQILTATGAGAVPGFGAVGVGSAGFTATGLGAVPAFAATAVGEQILTATGAGAVPGFAAVGVGIAGFAATGLGAVPGFGATGTASTLYTATGTGSVPGFGATGTAATIYTATGTGAVASFSATGVGVFGFDATGTGSVPSFGATATGTHTPAAITGVGLGAVPAFSAVGVADNGGFTATGVGAVPGFSARGVSFMGTICQNIADDLVVLFGLDGFGEAATYIYRDGALPNKPIQVVVDRAETVVLPETGMVSQESLIVHVPNDSVIGVSRIRTGDLISVPFRSGEAATQKMITRVISSTKGSFEVEVVG